MNTYYFGIYKDYYNKPEKKYAQLTTNVDNLSCEILANPGCITLYFNTIEDVIVEAKKLGTNYNCDYLELCINDLSMIKL